MIHVALDTNIYRKKPRLDSPEFRALVFLSKNGCIRLHVPFFVENEFKSQIELDQKKRVESILTILSKVCDYQYHGPITSDLVSIIESLGESKNEIIAERGNDFIQWLAEMNAIRYDLNSKETNDALYTYFNGKPPFKEPKIRKDIPDSFIYQTLLNIHNSENLHVVVEDGKLRDSCIEAGMICYKELTEFIKSDEANLLLQEKIRNDVLGTLESQIQEFLNNHNSLIVDKVEEKLLSDEYRMISGDYIPGESNEIYVSGVNEPHELKLDENIEYYGDSLFVVGFSAKVEFTYEYAVYKSDAYELDPKKYYLEYLNDHYFNVETTDEFTFTGRVELDYDMDLESVESVAQLLASLSDPAVTIEELDEFAVNA
ncbi:MAG: PIN domain-containing protein [Gammaproteobacteria bacterium]|nr:PIN domain-containing protein [Gammaproteobacteria bacterium]